MISNSCQSLNSIFFTIIVNFQIIVTFRYTNAILRSNFSMHQQLFILPTTICGKEAIYVKVCISSFNPTKKSCTINVGFVPESILRFRFEFIGDMAR